jgi:hypothetical protein
MLKADSIQSCVDSGAVNFVNSEPILDVVESRHIALLQMFIDSGATFFYCDVPNKTHRKPGEPFFTFTQHRVVRLDVEAQIVYCVMIWSSVVDSIESGNEPPSRFAYHPTMRQWRMQRKVIDPVTKMESYQTPTSSFGYITATPTGCVPSVLLAESNARKQQ